MNAMFARKDSAERYLDDAENLIHLRKFKLAARRAEQALALEPENPRTYYMLGWALWKLDKLVDAEIAAEKAIRCDATYPFGYSLLGMLCASREKWDEAQKYYQQAIQLDSQNADHHARMGQALWHKGDWRSAMRYYEQAIRLEPRCVIAHLLRAQIWISHHQLDDAEEHLLTALEISPQEPYAHELLGDLRLAQERGADAFAAYRSALRLDPNRSYIKPKLLNALKAKTPFLGEFWDSAYQHRRNRTRATISPLGTVLALLMLGVCPVITFFTFYDFSLINRLAAVLFACFPLLLLLFAGGLLQQILYDFADPLITFLVVKGWINL